MEDNNETINDRHNEGMNNKQGEQKDNGRCQYQSFKSFPYLGMALDPIHVGAGGGRLGRVDNAIVRDPVTRLPKIPGSSLAGVLRAYVAMAEGKYPDCAGLGQPNRDKSAEHCRKKDCPVCTAFGFAKGKDHDGGFAGLAAFSDMQILLFPVASHLGPQWVTAPMALRQLVEHNVSQCTATNDNEGKGAGQKLTLSEIDSCQKDVLYRKEKEAPLNLGWLSLTVQPYENYDKLVNLLKQFVIPDYITKRVGLVSDKLFSHIVNSNLEVRTSVAINPATGAAEDGALFTYEALPRGTVLFWELICKNPQHFKIDQNNKTSDLALQSPKDVQDVVTKAHPYLEHLGIGGMGTRGMGRLRVLEKKETNVTDESGKGEEQ